MPRLMLPCTTWSDRSEAVESILASAGFAEEGMIQPPGMEYSMLSLRAPDGLIGGMTWGTYPMAQPDDGNAVTMYCPDEISEDDLLKLASYGMRNFGNSFLFHGGSERHEYAMMTKLVVAHEHLGILATMARDPAGIRASRRLVEHASFYRFMERGGIHGMDQDDWASAERQETSRILCIIART